MKIETFASHFYSATPKSTHFNFSIILKKIAGEKISVGKYISRMRNVFRILNISPKKTNTSRNLEKSHEHKNDRKYSVPRKQNDLLIDDKTQAVVKNCERDARSNKMSQCGKMK